MKTNYPDCRPDSAVLRTQRPQGVKTIFAQVLSVRGIPHFHGLLRNPPSVLWKRRRRVWSKSSIQKEPVRPLRRPNVEDKLRKGGIVSCFSAKSGEDKRNHWVYRRCLERVLLFLPSDESLFSISKCVDYAADFAPDTCFSIEIIQCISRKNDVAWQEICRAGYGTAGYETGSQCSPRCARFAYPERLTRWEKVCG